MFWGVSFHVPPAEQSCFAFECEGKGDRGGVFVSIQTGLWEREILSYGLR